MLGASLAERIVNLSSINKSEKNLFDWSIGVRKSITRIMMPKIEAIVVYI
jgi:hypothetical protein